MNFSKYIATFDISLLKSLVSQIPESLWVSDTSRQNSFRAHKYTQSIFHTSFPFNWNPKVDKDYPLIKYSVLDKSIGQEIDTIIKSLEDFYNGKVGRSMLVRLDPESVITPHTDSGPYLECCHRCHIPIITNDFVHFFIGNEWSIMPEGECVEIDNTVTHSVVNYSETPRVHLIIDIIPNVV